MKKFVFVVLVAIGLTGCETMPYQLTTRTDRAALSEDQLIAQENQRKLTGRIESLEMQVSQQGRDIDTLRSQIDSRLSAMDRKSDAERKELVSRLSGELDKLAKQAAVPAPAPVSKSSASAYGIEHVVRSGETLYTIAKAYNVSAKAILDANKLQDGGRLSVGQKLFIPDVK